MPMKDLIMENLRRQRVSGAYCDLKIEAGRHNVWAHSAVVCPLSGYFNMHKESFIVSVDSKSECLKCLLSLLDVMYGLNVNIPDSHMDHIIEYCQLLMPTKALMGPLKKIGLTINDDRFERAQVTENSIPGPSNAISEEIEEIQPPGRNNEKNSLPKGSFCLECGFNGFTVDTLYRHLQETNHSSKICSICMETLTNGVTLEDHLLSHSDLAPIRCRQCGLRFNDPRSKNAHVAAVHKFNCVKCKRSFCTLENLYSHLLVKLHGGKVCSICKNTLAAGETLKQHLTLHSDLAPFPCTRCNQSFKSEILLMAHVERHGEKIHCRGCNCKFFNVKQLCRHLRKTNHSEGLCSVCNRVLSEGETLQQHLLTHSKDSNSPTTMSAHPRNNDNKIRCRECQRNFSGLDELYRHLQETNHSGDVCSICDTTLSYRETLERHLTLHSNVARCPCSFCGLRFKNRHQLISHVTTTHEKIVCLDCGRKFTEMDDLYRHLQKMNHNSKVCSICNGPLPQGVTIKEHLSLHLDVAPFACPCCGLRFRNSNKKISHMKCH